MLQRDVLNKLLVMRLIELSNGVQGKTRLQKLVFETEARSRRYGISETFNYKFIRWHYGPYAKELTEDMEFLIKKDFVTEVNNTFVLSERGQQNINRTRNIINQFFNGENIMLQTIRELRDIPLNDLLTVVYNNYGVRNFKMGEVIEDLKYLGV